VTPSGERLAEDLFERHGRQVRQYLRGLTGSTDLAQDLAQDVFVRVVRSSDRYSPSDRERPWLFRIARNVFIDHHRRHGSRAEVSLDGCASSGSPTQDLRLEIRRAIGGLPALEREAFLLAQVGGLGYAEIAETLSVTVPAVRSLIYRARLALRSALRRPRPTPAFPRREQHDD
jgi:RNA polymerase sigma factor (sigma-70 family)